MAYTFGYYLQGEFTGETRDGSVNFVLEKPFTATIDSTNYDYATGAVVSMDLNDDFMPDSVHQLLHSLVQEYCIRYGVDINTVILKRANIWLAEQTAMANIYFHPSSPTRQTTDPNALIYAYLLDSTVLNAPHNLTANVLSTTVGLFWEHDGYAIGFRIYSGTGELLATVGNIPTEWGHDGLTPSTVYTYRVTAYNANGESGYAELTVRTEGEAQDLPERIGFDEAPAPVEHAPTVDYEQGRITAFQSGVGDSLDLFVKTDKEQSARELVTYEMQVKGYEIETVQIYEKKEFRYRFVVSDTLGTVIDTSVWYDAQVDGVEPMDVNGGGKNSLRVPLEIEATGSVLISVEVSDPSGMVDYSFEKGTKPATSYPDDFVIFESLIESYVTKNIKKPHYGPKVKGKGIYTVTGNEIILIDDEIPSPYYDATFYNQDGTQKDIKEWDIIIYEQNPNVTVSVYLEPTNFWYQKKFLMIRLQAQIMNTTQTPWTPLVHNGYYYLNQSERYLYSKSEVHGWEDKAKSFVPLRFPYTIETYATRTIPGKVQEFIDEYKKDFSGSFNNVTLEKTIDDLTLLDNNLPGTYISGPKTFNNIAEYYEPIAWNAITEYGSVIKVFSQSRTRTGEWTNWVEEINGEVLKSPLSREVRYKIDMTAGNKKNHTITEYTDAAASEFMLGIMVNEGEPVLHENTAVINDTIGMADVEFITGLYTSATFDIGTEIDSLGKITYKPIMPAGIDGAITLYTASSSTDTNWKDEIWQPLRNIIVNEDGTITGEVQSTIQQFVRYQIRFKRSAEQVEILNEIAGDEQWNEGRHLNTISLHSTLRLQDTTQVGVYVTRPMHFHHNLAWLTETWDYTMPYNGGSVVIKTISTNDSSRAWNVTHNDPEWVSLNGTDVASPVADYLVIRIEFHAGLTLSGNSESPLFHGIKVSASATKYNTPLVDMVNIKSNTFYMTKESPVLKRIRIAGKYENIVSQELYVTSIQGEVISDRELYRITEDTVYNIVQADLIAKATNFEFLTLDMYQLKTKMPGVILTSRDRNDQSIIMDEKEIQNGYVYAQTTDVAQEYVYRQIRIKVGLDNTALASPAPQQGAPVVIQGASGEEMTHVPFTDGSGYPTLDFSEEIISDGRNMIALTYPNLDINTLKLEIYHDDVQIWQEVVFRTANHHFITLDDNYPIGTIIRATYRIQNSFCIDYEYEQTEELVKIYFHNPVLDTTREVRMQYETNKISAYYTANEIDFNPLKNRQSAGFVYLTDKVEPAYKMEILFPADVMYANGHDAVYVNVYVTDKYGNPIVGDVIEFVAEEGTVQLIQNITDKNGLAIGKYIAGKLTGSTFITAINRTSHLEITKELLLKDESLPSRIIATLSDYSIVINTETTIEVHVVDNNQEFIAYTPVTVTIDGVSHQLKTNFHGKAKMSYTPTTEGLKEILITATEAGLSETVLLRVNGGAILV